MTMLNVFDLQASFDTDGWSLGFRCIPILYHSSGEPIDNFKKDCMGRILYRMFGYDGRLLYIGMTSDLHKRCNHGVDGHRVKHWWKQVAFISVNNTFTTRAELLEAEIAAIQQEDPFYNIAATVGVTYRRNGFPGVSLSLSSPSIFKLADALWQIALDQPRREVIPTQRDPEMEQPLSDGEGLSDTWQYRQPINTGKDR